MSFLDKFRRPDRTISDMYREDLAKILIGRRVVNISTDEKLLELDDGTVMHFEDTSDCCAWFSDCCVTEISRVRDRPFRGFLRATAIFGHPRSEGESAATLY